MSTVVELNNDLVVIGETAARAFIRGTEKLKEHIEPMALGLAEARKRYPSDPLFGVWLKSSSYAQLNRTDRAALIKLGERWYIDNMAERLTKVSSSSPEIIWSMLRQDKPLSDNLSEAEDNESEEEEEEKDSGFYGSERIARSNEAWDTIDPRLVKSLVEAIPGLKDRWVWEPSAGCGMMLDQLEASGVRVYAATDIEPRREDIAQLDLLTAIEMPAGTNAAVTNPPWGRLAAPFVRHTLKLAEVRKAMVAMLLPLPWITGRRVADLTGSPSFEALVVPRYRARWMTPEEEAELEDGPSAPKMNHVWLVWDFARDPKFAPIIKFIDAPADEEVEE